MIDSVGQLRERDVFEAFAQIVFLNRNSCPYPGRVFKRVLINQSDDESRPKIFVDSHCGQLEMVGCFDQLENGKTKTECKIVERKRSVVLSNWIEIRQNVDVK